MGECGCVFVEYVCVCLLLFVLSVFVCGFVLISLNLMIIIQECIILTIVFPVFVVMRGSRSRLMSPVCLRKFRYPCDGVIGVCGVLICYNIYL